MSKFGVWQDVQSCPDGDVWFALSCGHVVMGYKQGPHLLDWEASIDHDCCADASAIKAQPVEPPKHPSLPPAPGEQVGEIAGWQRRDKNIVTGEWSDWHEDDDTDEELDPEWAERRAVYTAPPSTSALVEALEGYEKAIRGLFAHCLSNGVFNALGAAHDCTALNHATHCARAALAAHRKETA